MRGRRDEGSKTAAQIGRMKKSKQVKLAEARCAEGTRQQTLEGCTQAARRYEEGA